MKSVNSKKAVIFLAVLMFLSALGSVSAWQGEGFKGRDCSAVGHIIEGLPVEQQEEISAIIALFRDKLEDLRADFHAMEAPRSNYREEFHKKREEARQEMLNSLPEEVAEEMISWRGENAGKNGNGEGGMRRNQSLAGNKGGGGMQHHRQ